MRETTFTELRNQAKFYFDLVEEGEVIRVLRNGRAIAEIHPVAAAQPSWKMREPRPLTVGGRAVSDLIREDRGE